MPPLHSFEMQEDMFRSPVGEMQTGPSRLSVSSLAMVFVTSETGNGASHHSASAAALRVLYGSRDQEWEGGTHC